MFVEEIQLHLQTLMGNLFQENEPLMTATMAATLAAVLFLLLYLGQRRRNKHVEVENRRLTAVAMRAKEILATTPDGLFLWDHIIGGIACSQRLATLLDLKQGTNARYDDIRDCFKGDSLKTLERSVSSLRSTGTPFSIILYLRENTLEAIGARAETSAGQPVADLVWVRDITHIDKVSQTHESDLSKIRQIQNTSGLDDRHLTNLLDAIPIPIWLRDSSLRIAFANQAAEPMVDQDARMAEAARIRGEAFTERQQIEVNGVAHLMDITEISLGASNGNTAETQRLGGSVGFAIDRSENQAVRVENEQTKMSWGSVLQSLGTAISIFDINQKLQFSNSAFAEIFGLNTDWLAQNPILGDILDRQRDARTLPEVTDFNVFKTTLGELFSNLTEPSIELMHLPDGRTLRQTISPHSEGGLIFTFEDVSEQLSLERSMKESGAVQRETLDNLHEGVAVFGTDGRLKLSNPLFERIWELDLKQLGEEPNVSQIIEQTRPLLAPPQDLQSWNDAQWLEHSQQLKMQMLSRTSESGHMHLRNGKVIQHTNIPLPDGAVLLSYLDITDSSRVEKALRERAEAFQEADRLKTEFISKVSYEMRTPLNTVIGFADMLSQNLFGELNARQSEYANGILNTSQTLVSLLEDILDLASIEAGRLELNNETFDIHAFLVSSLKLVQERIRQKKQKLDFECPTDIGWMNGDENRLKQVLFNLLSNSISFTPSHGRIKLLGFRQEGEFVFSVSDSGRGIPSNDRHRLFQPFEQGETKVFEDQYNATTSGKGLGLSIVRNLIELHGGTVELKSQPSRGTTVTCRIPIGGPDELKNTISVPPLEETELSKTEDG